MSDAQVDIEVSALGASSAVDKAAETQQLDDRHVGQTFGGGISPPYPPGKIASLQEANGTHAVAIRKKSVREVGFGFNIVPARHFREDKPDILDDESTDDEDEDEDDSEGPSESEYETVREFWYGPDKIWKIGPKGTPAATPTEVFEQARRDWHGIGWLAIEVIYGDDDTPQGLAHAPAVEIRVVKDDDASTSNPGHGSVAKAGHGYVQEEAGQKIYYGEAGDRGQGVDDEDRVYVDKFDGTIHDSIEECPNEPANEILFVPNPSPLAKYYGIPDWVAEIQTMVASQEAKRFNRQFFEFDAMPQYAVIVEGGRLTEESKQQIRDMVTRLRQNETRRVVTLEAEQIAEKGIDFEGDTSDVSIRIEPLSRQGEEDMAFTEFRRMNEHDVAKVHEIPHVLINRLESSNRANAREQIRDFTEEVIKPQQQAFAQRIYRVIHQRVLGVNDWTIEFETKTGDEQRQAEVSATRIQASDGSMYVNEAREELGLEPDEELDGVLLAELSDPSLGEVLTDEANGEPDGPDLNLPDELDI